MSASPAVVVCQDGENQLAVLSNASENCGDASLIELDKEASMLGEDISTKVRKPYTITKQRERWTDEEHQRFLEALKLYGRAWRQIEEHVGTKTAVQIRSHAQKFFSKLEREGSSGSLKAPVSEIDIPPPRPKRKPAHPYPRKGIALSSQNVSLLSPVSGTESSGYEVSLHCDTAVAVMRTNKLPTSNILETTSPHPLNCSAKKAAPVSFCQKPRKRGTEEVQCDAFPNEAQEMPKLSRSTCSEAELSLSPIGISALQPDTLMLHNNNVPFGVHGSKLLTTFQQMAVPYHHPMHSMAALQHIAPLLNSATTNPSQLGKLDDMPALTSLLAAHAHLRNSIMPWINHNPIALAAAAAAAAATAWPGLGLQPPPLHLPLRPPSIFSDRLNIESSSTVAAAMAAAAAASFADASAWLALHGTFAHPPNIPEGRSLYKPNPVVHSAFVEGHQQQVLTDSSEGSKNGDNGCEQTSSAEHEASTLDGMPETITHINHPNPMPSSSNQQSNSHQCEKETSKTQENRGHNSSTDSSSNEKKGKKRNGLNCPSGNFLLVESKNGLQDSAYLTVHDKKLGRESTEVNSSEMDLSPSMYQGSNSLKCNISPKISKEDEEDCEYNGKINDSLDALTSSVLVTDCTLEEQSGSSVGRTKDFIAPQCTTNTSQMEIQAEIRVSLQRKNGSSRTRDENMSGEVSITANQQQCISSCGSTENKKAKAQDSPVISSKIKDIAMKESKPKHHTEDCGSEITPYEKAGKVLVQACLKRWQGGEIMFTHACTNSKSIVATTRGNSTCRAEAKENNSQQEEARSSLAMGLINGSKQSLPLIQTQSLHESNASSSGSSKYKGHGFVPYRRS